MNQERYEFLMVKVVDHTATPAEREELMAWVMDRPEQRRELESHQAVKAVTDGWVERLMLDLAEDRVQAAPSRKLGVGVGLGLLSAGVLTLLGWGLGQLFMDPGVPLAVALGIAAITIGFFLLLGIVVRGRVITHKSDKYEDIVR